MDEEEVAVEVIAFGEKRNIPIDTAALSIWVDQAWFESNGGKLISRGGAAQAADGSDLEVIGTGELEFGFWGLTFREKVRVMSTLPDKLPIGRTFWRKHGLILNLGQNTGSVRYEGARVDGVLGSRNNSGDDRWGESVRAVIEDADVDQALQDMDLRAFSQSPSKRNKLRKILWKRRDIFKGMAALLEYSTRSR